MTLLIADVGGTNTRVAMVTAGADAPEATRHFNNADHGSLYAVLDAYRDDVGTGAIAACSVAMAGPVRGGQGRLTNRGWDISTAGLREVLSCDRALLLNDLPAIGYAVRRLPAAGKRQVADTGAARVRNGQSLVVGIGTGFNLCPVKTAADGSVRCFEVEAGHVSLPHPLMDRLRAIVGDAAPRTVEDVFSGDGLAQFHAQRVTGAQMSAREIVEAHEAGSDAQATQTLGLYMGLLGQLCTELSLQYMPLDGIYFAGSVARGILMPTFYDALLGEGAEAGKVGNLLRDIPKFVILDDAGALLGCIEALEQMQDA